MKIELHILQNFAPSNLNRDDTGAPKDCELGGYRRGRISSQCLKRAVRDLFKTDGMFEPSELAVRTKRLVENVADELASKHNRDRTLAIELVAAALAGAGLKVKGADEDHKSEYLLFLPKRHLAHLAALIHKHWDTLTPLVAPGPKTPLPDAPAKSKTKKKEKAEKKSAFPKEVGNELIPILKDAARTPDLALFGRMIADEPSWNVDAACQVAHAISTNRVTMDFDFYTAVDDLRPEDTAGSDMMGTVQFNSSCFYRYSVLDVTDLRGNLGADELVGKTVGAYIRASVLAIPTGKQNSMAAHNPPSFVLAIAREDGTPISLANAFAQPVRPNGDADLVTASIDALQEYLQRVSRMYGARQLAAFYIADREITHVKETENKPDSPGRSEGQTPTTEPIKLVNKNDLDALVKAVQDKISGVME